MTLPQLFQVDAFTHEPFRGNPAAVCLLSQPRDDSWQQRVAFEMNLSETAYVRQQDDGSFRLRWFTPKTEVDLCGHATLAAAHVLWEQGIVDRTQPIRFATKSGPLVCRMQGERIEMDFPATPLRSNPPSAESSAALQSSLGVECQVVGQTKFDLLVRCSSQQEVLALEPDFRQLAMIPTRGIIATARAETPKVDFVSRFFAPQSGIDEDPVTGSAHCCLGPYWAKLLDKRSLVGYQASARGGIVHARVKDDRVILGGQAVTILRGELVA